MELAEGAGGAAAKKPKPSPAPAIAVLGDNLLGEILLRLPDMASLASAALACKDLPAVDSDAEEEGYDWHEWRLRGCDGGRLLLSRGRDGMDLAVYDPIARTAVFLRPENVFGAWTHSARYAIVVDESDGSFLVIGFGFSFRAAVFSSRTGTWVNIDVEKIKMEKSNVKHEEEDEDVYLEEYEDETFVNLHSFYSDGMTAGRFAYWRSDTKKHRYCNPVERILVLDTTSMECKEQCLQLWVCNSIGGWVLKKDFSLLNEWMKKIRRAEWMKRVHVLAARAGYVYMEFWSIRKANSYFLVLNLRTMDGSVS
ncbi:hypothetical protein HU200_058304 [Digitaria exilis]|uniref:Uncharacterized protein n=1 Tax=Digitaria exilis TaxID=1010633 RepID=A0A835E3G4_9POAL|nr:hypothetical protein HU200_058304 [Digitaria exilis]